ncbi:hypothetical protein [Streptomyces sp. HF10]|uniref:hypothetical protein n=1 Tax=Streptomyces sp. HF10 TaxID=2692233 RepID=UPI0013177B56|nr:hypothetical protein [Streptomyces sp. HF10]QHC28613.1 hypothetical protein GR129_07055 [Streptomyces sp. HF10]
MAIFSSLLPKGGGGHGHGHGHDRYDDDRFDAFDRFHRHGHRHGDRHGHGHDHGRGGHGHGGHGGY